MKLCGVFEAELLVYYQHRKFVTRAYEKTGHFASREGISRDAGHMGRNTGCPVKYGTVGNPRPSYGRSTPKRAPVLYMYIAMHSQARGHQSACQLLEGSLLDTSSS